MRKILALLVILAALVSVGCKQAVKLDVAGNPAALTGTWDGSITVKEDNAFTLLTKVGGTIYEGTWDIAITSITPMPDRTVTSVSSGVTTSTTYIHYPSTTTLAVQRVIAKDGSYVTTTTTTTTHAARALITVPTDTATQINVYRVYASTDETGAVTVLTSGQTSVALLSGEDKQVDVKTVNVVPQSDGLYLESSQTTTTTTKSGALYPAASTPSSTVTTVGATTWSSVLSSGSLTFSSNPLGAGTLVSAAFTHTVSYRQPYYLNDAVYTYSFAIAKDGTYVLTETKVTTQADIAAAAAVADGVASSPAVVAGVMTEKVVFSGTVAAWTAQPTALSGDFTPAEMIVFSGIATEQTWVGTGAFLDATMDASSWSAMFDVTYTYRMMVGTKDKDGTAAMTRLVIDDFQYATVLGATAPGAGATLILDKQ